MWLARALNVATTALSFAVLLGFCPGVRALSPKAKSLLGHSSSKNNKHVTHAPTHVVPPGVVQQTPKKTHHDDDDDASHQSLRVIGVLDLECTCEPGWGAYMHEVIEFPVVLVDARSRRFLGEFHSYVRPTENATLSSFCTELTGIEQATVDAAPTLDVVLDRLDAFLLSQGVRARDDPTFALATDGWDLRHFLDTECRRKGLPKPSYLNRWCDLSKTFGERQLVVAKLRAQKRRRRLGVSGTPPPPRRANLGTMLRHYNMAFVGRPHSGIDDARNIAALALRMLRDAPLRVNDRLDDPESTTRRPFQLPSETSFSAAVSTPPNVSSSAENMDSVVSEDAPADAPRLPCGPRFITTAFPSSRDTTALAAVPVSTSPGGSNYSDPAFAPVVAAAEETICPP